MKLKLPSIRRILDPLGLFGDDSRGFDKSALVPTPPPPMAPDIASAEAEVIARQKAEALDERRKRRGRAATLLTGSEGAGLPATAAKSLLGE